LKISVIFSYALSGPKRSRLREGGGRGERVGFVCVVKIRGFSEEMTSVEREKQDEGEGNE
jgi:hypothetical protein